MSRAARLAARMMFQQPEVRLEAVRLGSAGLSGGTIHAVLVVSNRNSHRSGQVDRAARR